jgi:ABC-type uncharacterized transport system permease subunit
MFTSLASFHPGHGTTAPGSVIHYVTEPVHVVTLVLVAVALLVVAGALWSLALRSSKKI